MAQGVCAVLGSMDVWGDRTMSRAKMPFGEKRRVVQRAATDNNRGTKVSKHVDFADDDVPAFLEEFRRFQEQSRAQSILAR